MKRMMTWPVTAIALAMIMAPAAASERVTVESAAENVRVAKSVKSLILKVSGSEAGQERVDIKLPLAVVDALLSGPPNELNFVAALKAPNEEGDCELVAVHDESSVVRMWVDGKNENR